MYNKQEEHFLPKTDNANALNLDFQTSTDPVGAQEANS